MKYSSIKMRVVLFSAACIFPNLAIAKRNLSDVDGFRRDVHINDNVDGGTFNEGGLEQNLKYVNFKIDLEKFYRNYTGSVDRELKYFVPTDVNQVHSQWSSARASIHSKVGQVSPSLDELPDAVDWRNSATTINDLYNAALRNVAGFKGLFRGIVSQIPGAWVSFGPGDNFAVKSKQSLTDKVNRQTNNGVKDPVSKISDALRGTIVVNSPNQFAQVIGVLNRTFNNTNIVFSDKFSEPPYATGYVGVHGGLLYKNGTDAIQSEMQVHFSNVMDGGANCPKEYTHAIYEKTRSLENKPAHEALTAKGNIAQKIVYLFGLDRVLKGIIPVPNSEASPSEVSDSPYVYRYDSGMLVRSQIDTFGKSSDPYGAAGLPSLEVYNPSTCKWNLVTAPEQQLTYYNMLEESGDAVSEKTAGYIQNKMATINVADLNGQNGFIINGFRAISMVQGLGDINSDGIDDIGMSGSVDEESKEQAYIIYGKASLNPKISVKDLTSDTGFIITDNVAQYPSTYLGHIGDINRDGIQDIAGGGWDYNSRFAYVYFGTKDKSQFQKTTSALNGQNGFGMVNGFAGNGYTQKPIDFNGDSIYDVVTGGSGNNSGYVYVIYGTNFPFPARLDLSALNGKNGATIEAYQPGSISSIIASLGDINGDGIDDLAFSDNADVVYVVFGSKTFPASFSAANLNGTNGFTISYDEKGAQFGHSVAGAGDINGDGINDILIGAPWGHGLAGGAYVVFGSRSGYPASINVNSLNGQNGFEIVAVAYNDHVGLSSAFIGDFNGDGIDDLFVGANSNGRKTTGAGYVIFGSRKMFADKFYLSQINCSNGRYVFANDPKTGYIGVSVGTGDFNHDGRPDIIVGTYETYAAVIFGGPN